MDSIKTTNSRNYFYKTLIIFPFGLLLSLNIYSKIELIDRVVAVVDSGVIMESQLNARVEDILLRFKST
mgnify:FL=1